MDANDDDPIDFANAAEPGSENYYLKQAWGAYGAAHRSQLFEIGIFDEFDAHDLPLPSRDIGERIADAFGDSIGEAASLFFDVVQRGRVTRDELDPLAAVTPSEISLTGDERAAYQQLLLRPVDHEDTRALARRDRVLLILNVSRQLGRDPTPEEVRWILYAGRAAEGRALSLDSAELQAQRRLWWIYQANDLCHVAFETLLKFTLDTLAESPNGVPLERLVPACVDKLLSASGTEPKDWAALVATVQPAANAYDGEPDSRMVAEHLHHAAGRSQRRSRLRAGYSLEGGQAARHPP